MATIQQLLAAARQNLLDLSNRNRLLNCRLDSERVVRVVDELPDQVYGMLVTDKKSMKFRPVPESEQDGLPLDMDESDAELEQPEDDVDGNGPAKRHTDSLLQTKFTSARLQTRLLRMYSEAQTAIEEQGINILYLAVGFLEWYESGSSDTPRYAPLILVPAKLERRSAASKFQLSWSEEDIEANESLVVKLQKEFGIELPRLPEDTESLTPSDYFPQVRKAIGKSRWEIVDDIALGFFAFGKLRLWKDLDPEVWAKGTGPEKSDIVRAILLAQQIQEPSPYSDEEFVDHLAGVGNILLVKDADSSQILSILDVLNDRSVIVQGPPGTGKSQTITNVIANTLAKGKTVLFVAEKEAALKVVKRWLDQVGLGDACLELHSFNSRKTRVIDSIRRTIESGRPVTPDRESESSRLGDLRKSLNAFAFAMNTPVAEGGISPHQAIGIVERYCQVVPPLEHVPLPAAATWTNSQLKQNRDNIELAAKHLGSVGNPRQHPWRGVMAPAMLPSDRQKLTKLAERLLSNFKLLLDTLGSVGEPLGLKVHYTLAHCAPMVTLCNLLLERPDSDLSGIASPVWLTNKADIAALLSSGCRYAALHSTLLEQVTAEALGQDYVQTGQFIRQMGRSATRFLSGDYWRARKRVIQTCMRGRQPRNYKEALSLLEDLCEYRELQTYITTGSTVGATAFGKQWDGLRSDWAVLQRVAGWVPKVIELIQTNSILEKCDGIGPKDLAQAKENVENLRQRIGADLDEWTEVLRYDCAEAFGETHDRESIPLETWMARLETAIARIEAVYEWIEYRKSRDMCKELEMSPLVDWFDSGGVAPDRLVSQYDYSSAHEILRAALTSRPALGQFNGETHDHIIEQFRALDRKLIETTRQYLAAKLWDGMPQPTVGHSDASPMNYLVNTLRRQRGIPPVRQLMERAGNIITQIKPCFMMSPMSIAQFLPPNTVEFDVLVIDEASQMKPEDALGALARCKQCVIVGDSKQLPPSAFFDRLMGNDGADDVDDIGDVESILEAAAQPIGGVRGGRMLRWHYRSRHESLIAFSNKEFYESRLHVFPSPVHACRELGLVGHFIENGVYARSGSRKNLVEAEEVAKAAMNHARNCGDLSLGVVALSKQQQEAIMDRLEELRRGNPETEWFFDSERLEPFFVKNLENVQGDERDVIFISIGYGKDPQGYFYMNFGPINREGGWRRLNVLITRARSRCEVFCSITPDQIRVTDLTDAEQYSLRGRVALRNYLEYVQTGQLEQPGAPGEDVESPFEESVSEALRQHGVEVVPQVGVAKFRIDLGVVDHLSPGRYLLGIECDGAAYHSARSARDRDRLRQEVLEKLGWRIHRIWSLDWLKDRDKEMRRLLLAIEEAKSEAARTTVSGNGPPKPQKATVIERTNTQKEARHPHELVSKPYLTYTGTRVLYGHPAEVSINRLADLIVEIVKVESPIHTDELCRRVAEAFGLQRTGSRIQDAALLAARRAESLGMITYKGTFVWDPTMKQPGVRNRQDMNMDVERVAPEEIQAAAGKVSEVVRGLTRDALISEVARSLGYLRVSANIAAYIRSALDDKR